MKKTFILLTSIIMFLGCSLDADNPNNLLEEQLGVSAFTPMVNGLEGVTVRAYGNILAPYSVASDEMIWIGSRDAWQQLNFGNVDNINNEFVDAAFFFVAEARYWADDVIARGEEFSTTNAFSAANKTDLVRAYWYGAVTYMVIADMFDDFVVGSVKTEAAPPVGPGNMGSLYDTAIGYLNKAIALNAGLTSELKATKARAEFSKGIWAKNNPVNTAAPLVSSASAAALAAEALTALGDDFSVNLVTSSSAPETIGGLDIAGEVNDRLEMRLSDTYVISTDAKRPDAIGDGNPATTVSLMDPIDNIADPALYKNIVNFTAPGLYPEYPVVSGREMHLIIAENALANGDTATFTAHINKIRALDNLTPYSGQMDAQDLLEHSRRVNLFLQGRRISDHYRFASPSEYWIGSSPAINSPGTFLPITISEIQSNENIN
ncbi:MAG: hypothetical protein O3C13_08575 [Bacteroidetes bacterium]|nr:hypothetical protein [Bacteroidota bacterium]